MYISSLLLQFRELSLNFFFSLLVQMLFWARTRCCWVVNFHEIRLYTFSSGSLHFTLHSSHRNIQPTHAAVAFSFCRGAQTGAAGAGEKLNSRNGEHFLPFSVAFAANELFLIAFFPSLFLFLLPFSLLLLFSCLRIYLTDELHKEGRSERERERAKERRTDGNLKQFQKWLQFSVMNISLQHEIQVCARCRSSSTLELSEMYGWKCT